MSSAGYRDTPPAAPKYRVGEHVLYVDHHGREQRGEVRWIEAKWHGWGHGPVEPLIIYSLRHPTYRNNNFYGGEKDILRALTRREYEGYRYA